MIWIGFWDRGGWSHGSYTLVDDNHVFCSLFGVHTACPVFFIGLSVLGSGLLVMFFGRRTSGFSTALERLIN